MNSSIKKTPETAKQADMVAKTPETAKQADIVAKTDETAKRAGIVAKTPKAAKRADLLPEMDETLDEFLAYYDATKYKHPSVAVDCVVRRGGEILLVRRGGHPYKGKLALPGGFVEEGESAEQAVARELMEETGLKVRKLRQFGFASTPGRDPRDWNISLVFTAQWDGGEPRGGDDAAEAGFYEVKLEGNTLYVGGERTELDIVLNECGELDFDGTKILSGGVLAFDHAKIIAATLIKGV